MTTSTTGVLRVVREDYLGSNTVLIDATRDLLRAKVARLRALRTLDELNEEKASRAVWVPPSSSRSTKHGTKTYAEDLASKLRASKTNARLHADEVRRPYGDSERGCGMYARSEVRAVDAPRAAPVAAIQLQGVRPGRSLHALEGPSVWR